MHIITSPMDLELSRLQNSEVLLNEQQQSNPLPKSVLEMFLYCNYRLTHNMTQLKTHNNLTASHWKCKA